MTKLPKRKQIRIKDYDYSQNGYYYITICTKDKQQLLSKIINVGADIIRPQLTEYGKIVDKAINNIPFHYPNIKIDYYVIMPNHIHFILVISNDDKNGRIISAPTISRIIGQMKSWITKKIGISIWQKSYYEHIIRDEDDYINTAEYILNNPLKWEIKEKYGILI